MSESQPSVYGKTPAENEKRGGIIIQTTLMNTGGQSYDREDQENQILSKPGVKGVILDQQYHSQGKEQMNELIEKEE